MIHPVRVRIVGCSLYSIGPVQSTFRTLERTLTAVYVPRGFFDADLFMGEARPWPDLLSNLALEFFMATTGSIPVRCRRFSGSRSPAVSSPSRTSAIGRSVRRFIIRTRKLWRDESQGGNRSSIPIFLTGACGERSLFASPWVSRNQSTGSPGVRRMVCPV